MSAPRDAIQLSLVPEVDGQTVKEEADAVNVEEAVNTEKSSDETSTELAGSSSASLIARQDSSLHGDADEEDEEELPLSASSSGELNLTLSPVSATTTATITGDGASFHASSEATDISADEQEADSPTPSGLTAEGAAVAPDNTSADTPTAAAGDASGDASGGEPASTSDESSPPKALPEAAAGGGGGDEPPVAAVTHAQDAGGPPPEANEEPMTLIDHLNELRHRLTRVIILVLLGFFACYGVSEALYAWLSAPLTAALPAGSKLIYTSPQGAFFVYMKVALVASIFLTSPFTFYQLWSFIAPGLYKEEKKAVMPLAFFSAFFFLSGASFCYYLVFPIAFQFFMGFATDVIIPMISVEEYLSFALKLLIAFGLVFEMPLFAYFLARMGLLTAEMMRRQRKYAILAIFIVAAILTPPDVFSQCLMAAPMLLLYEVSIYVAKSARKSKDAEDKKPDDPANAPAGHAEDSAPDDSVSTPAAQEEK